MRRGDYTALRILTSLCAAEVAILYVIIAVETPVAPVVRRLLETPSGLVVVVTSVVGVLLLGMIGMLLLTRGATPVIEPQSEGIDP